MKLKLFLRFIFYLELNLNYFMCKETTSKFCKKYRNSIRKDNDYKNFIDYNCLSVNRMYLKSVDKQKLNIYSLIINIKEMIIKLFPSNTGIRYFFITSNIIQDATSQYHISNKILLHNSTYPIIFYLTISHSLYDATSECHI